MKFTTFLLDQWLQQHAGTEFNLGGSTGPRWTPRQLLALAEDTSAERILDLDLDYTPTSGSTSLREAIAKMQGVSAEEVIVFAGSAEALFQIFYLAAEPGANVIIPFPCFPSHQVIPESLGFEIRRYHLSRENSYRIDLDEVKSLANRKTKILVVNSPHNPTGATLNNDQMRRLHDSCAEHGIQFVSDEVFHPIYHGPETDSAARLSCATVVGDFSKALSLPGLRLGWIVERDGDRRREYVNAREYLTVSNTPMGVSRRNRHKSSRSGARTDPQGGKHQPRFTRKRYRETCGHRRLGAPTRRYDGIRASCVGRQCPPLLRGSIGERIAPRPGRVLGHSGLLSNWIWSGARMVSGCNGPLIGTPLRMESRSIDKHCLTNLWSTAAK
jgi:hypothetical protein